MQETRGWHDKKEITFQITAAQAVISADEVSVTKLLTILIDNAIKYTPKFGAVNVAVHVVKKHLEIRVKDTGIGIPKKDLPHIFDRFYRTDRSRTKTGTSGFGLGLAIAKQIVLSQKGTMTVISKEGKGTMFVVKLPIDE